MADQVAKPIEDTINTINGVKHITSNSSEGITQIIAEFDTSVDVNKAEQDVREKVNAILPQLPRDVRDPVFFKFDPNDLPILTVAVSVRGRAIAAAAAQADRQRYRAAAAARQRRRLGDRQRRPGAPDQRPDGSEQAQGLADPAGADHPRDPDSQPNLGLGSITAGNQDISLRAPSMIQTPQDIARIQITGTPYRIGDVATIEDGVAEVNSYARLDGKDAIAISIRKQSGSNTVQVADDVKARDQEDLRRRARSDAISFRAINRPSSSNRPTARSRSC